MPKDVSRRGRALRTLACVALACLFLAACGGDSGGSGSEDGGTKVTDLSELEAKLVAMQEEKVPDLAVEGAQCPAEVNLEEGTTFECTVTIEGVDAPYAITPTKDDPEAEVGSFHIEPAKAIINVSIVTDFINTQTGATDAKCGNEKVLVSEVGGTFDCTVSVGGQTQDVEMIVKDLEGTVAFNN